MTDNEVARAVDRMLGVEPVRVLAGRASCSQRACCGCGDPILTEDFHVLADDEADALAFIGLGCDAGQYHVDCCPIEIFEELLVEQLGKGGH